MGTFGGALEARHIDASGGRLVADVTGEVEKEEGVLVIRRIHVAMKLAAPESARETAERVHGMYAMRCRCTALYTRPSSSRRRTSWSIKAKMRSRPEQADPIRAPQCNLRS